MVDSGPIIILVCAFSCPSDVTFSQFFSSGITRGSGTSVFTFIFLISFLVIFNFCCNCSILAPEWLEKHYRFFAGFTSWSSSGYASTIFSLRCDRLVNGFECGALFIGLLTGSLLGVSFRLPMRLKPLEVMLGGLIFRIFPLGHSRLPCVHSLI